MAKMYKSHFSLENLPFGIASKSPDGPRGVVTRLDDQAVFLEELLKDEQFFSETKDHLDVTVYSQPSLNLLIFRSHTEHLWLRQFLQRVLQNPEHLPQTCLHPIAATTLHLPIAIRSFTDFSCSNSHLLNASEAMQKKRQTPPGHDYFPIGYTGRSSSIVVSGTPVQRPKGMFRNAAGEVVYGASERLDFELEVAAVIGKSTQLGETITSSQAGEYIFGYVLLNDWSARDIQGLEMPPLGPMNGKSFATTISPWVVTSLALEGSACAAPERSPTAAPYLLDTEVNNSIDIGLEVLVKTGNEQESVICKSNTKWLGWTFRDLVAQQTANGCAIEVGDLLATGTVSGDEKGTNGCLLEINKGGEVEVELSGGARRMWLEDGDTITLTALARHGVGFGECTGTISKAK